MSVKEKLKLSWKGNEGTAELAALLIIPFFMPIVAFMFSLYFNWYGKNTMTPLKTALVVVILAGSGLIIYKIFHLIINYFYHSINHDYLQNKIDSESRETIHLIIIAIPLSIMALFELSRLFSSLSESASANPIKAAIIYFSIALALIIIFIFRKQIGSFISNVNNSVNGFLFSQDELKSVPILLTITTIAIFILLIKGNFDAHFTEEDISNDITYLAMGLVLAPFLVYITSGALIYNSYEKLQDSKKINVLLKICTIISRIILVVVFTIIVVLVFIADFRMDYGHGMILFLYVSFTSIQIKKLNDDYLFIKNIKEML